MSKKIETYKGWTIKYQLSHFYAEIEREPLPSGFSQGFVSTGMKETIKEIKEIIDSETKIVEPKQLNINDYLKR